MKVLHWNITPGLGAVNWVTCSTESIILNPFIIITITIILIIVIPRIAILMTIIITSKLIIIVRPRTGSADDEGGVPKVERSPTELRRNALWGPKGTTQVLSVLLKKERFVKNQNARPSSSGGGGKYDQGKFPELPFKGWRLLKTNI